EGEDLRQRGAGTRFKRLSGANWGGFKNLALVPSAHRDEASKRKLVQDMRHKEGVVVKHKDHPYISGRPASGGKALKCKFWASCTAKVIAINAQRSI
ncbi:hypothetical protein ACI4BF_27810, partial [Klebsiella pneumoniae]|uniref:hypothetical protein n=1 Tax=Klebsiella pneumoniae TaxID=573 RepID=UPI003851FB7F